MRKFLKEFIILGISLLILSIALIWEHVYNVRSNKSWAERIEQKLHVKELEADKFLYSLKPNFNIESNQVPIDVSVVGFYKDSLLFWTNSRIGCDDLSDVLINAGNFIEINSAYYEIRRRNAGEYYYYALIFIRDKYPYVNSYVTDNFASFLKIGSANSANLRLMLSDGENRQGVQSREEKLLFYVQCTPGYRDSSLNYGLLVCYLLYFLSMFYVYDALLSSTSSIHIQIGMFLAFIGVLIFLRYLMFLYDVPSSIFQSILFRQKAGGLISISVGDLLLSAFGISQVLCITLNRLNIDYQVLFSKFRRFALVIAFVAFAVAYVNIYSFVVHKAIDSLNVYLNLAQFTNIGLDSIIVFFAISLGGVTLVLLVQRMTRVIGNIMEAGTIDLIALSMGVVTWIISFIPGIYVDLWGTVVCVLLFVILTLYKYFENNEVHRVISLLAILLLSFYIVVMTRSVEIDKEVRNRASIASSIIEERDELFEKRLVYYSNIIIQSDEIASMASKVDESEMNSFLNNNIIDAGDYNYMMDVTLCRVGDSIIVDNGETPFDCVDFFGSMILNKGVQIGESQFFSIREFDGLISYIGQFRFGLINMFIRFDSFNEDEGVGYPQILSRRMTMKSWSVYQYSYAKYRDNNLFFSSGDCNYHKRLNEFAFVPTKNIIIEDEGYSHMLIPIDDNSVFVISLSNSVFSLYYLNVLHVFLVCILFSSYGSYFVFLRPRRKYSLNTIRDKVKYSMIGLIFVLFIVLTSMSIFLSRRSFQERRRTKTTEVLRFIVKELEPMQCVEWNRCPEINDKLAYMSEMFLIDVNLYDFKGSLVATSRPEIFSAGFEGNLLNPGAKSRLINKLETSYVDNGHIGELDYISAYMPFELENGQRYIVNVPYFTQNNELNKDTLIMMIISINIAVVLMMIAYILSDFLADRITKPLKMVVDKFKIMNLGGKNAKIFYAPNDEVGVLLGEYNNMVDKLEESARQLSKSERESAWRGMARQIAHEIKNPLTPMKLNIQFMQRSMGADSPEEFKNRFTKVSKILIEQIDNMAAIATAFSNFAKMSAVNCEMLNISELVEGQMTLFHNDVDEMTGDIEPNVMAYVDREHMIRAVVNVLKNAEQSIPEGRKGKILVSLHRNGNHVVIKIRDNGKGVSPELADKIFEPNFTTKTGGMGLGLAITKSILESMGGTIGYTSVINEGTEFIITVKTTNDEKADT